MSSKDKNKKSKVLLRILYTTLTLILLFLVTIYVFVPSYRFEDPKPFSGKFIHNPYQKLTNSDWNHYNFRDTLMNFNITSYEYGYGLSQAKYFCLDHKSKRKIDYPFFQNIHFKQHSINSLNKTSSLVIPTNLDKGFKLREIKYLDNYRLMEVLSSYGVFTEYWDLALSAGHRVNIFATSYLNNFKHSVVINSDYNSKEQIIKSLQDGDFYAISYKNDDNLPELKDIKIINDSIFINLTKTAKEIRFIGQNGIIRGSICNINHGVYIFKDDDSYIRIEASFDDGSVIYFNPIVRHQFQYFFDPILSEIMTERTWLMRCVYIFVIIFFGRYLLKR